MFRPCYQGLCLREGAEPHLTDNDRESIMAASLDRMSRFQSTMHAMVCCLLLGHLQPTWHCVCQGLNMKAEKSELYCQAIWLHQFCKFSVRYKCHDPGQGELLQTRYCTLNTLFVSTVVDASKGYSCMYHGRNTRLAGCSEVKEPEKPGLGPGLHCSTQGL